MLITFLVQYGHAPHFERELAAEAAAGIEDEHEWRAKDQFGYTCSCSDQCSKLEVGCCKSLLQHQSVPDARPMSTVQLPWDMWTFNGAETLCKLFLGLCISSVLWIRLQPTTQRTLHLMWFCTICYLHSYAFDQSFSFFSIVNSLLWKAAWGIIRLSSKDYRINAPIRWSKIVLKASWTSKGACSQAIKLVKCGKNWGRDFLNTSSGNALIACSVATTSGEYIDDSAVVDAITTGIPSLVCVTTRARGDPDEVELSVCVSQGESQPSNRFKFARHSSTCTQSCFSLIPTELVSQPQSNGIVGQSSNNNLPNLVLLYIPQQPQIVLLRIDEEGLTSMHVRIHFQL